MRDRSWPSMGFPVLHAVITLLVALLFGHGSEYADFLLKIWFVWPPLLLVLFRSRTRLWWLPLLCGAPFWAFAAWLVWGPTSAPN